MLSVSAFLVSRFIGGGYIGASELLYLYGKVHAFEIVFKFTALILRFFESGSIGRLELFAAFPVLLLRCTAP